MWDLIGRKYDFMAGTVLAALLGVVMPQSSSVAQSASHEQLQDAWWTGPMLAPSAETLPRGHFLVEPYVYDAIMESSYNSHRQPQSAQHENEYGSLTYVLYGLANRFTVGMIPTLGSNQISGSPVGSIGLGDLSLQAQYRLLHFREGARTPSVSFALQESMPTGKYDRLTPNAADGLGSGAWTTSLSLYSQDIFWMPNGRILRGRLNFTESLPSSVSLSDASVYGTEAGFKGSAVPGKSSLVDLAFEYSLSRHWVIAMEGTYRTQANTTVQGTNSAQSVSQSVVNENLGSNDAVSLAPAVEYNVKPALGVLFGMRLVPTGRNVDRTMTPVLAVNFVH